MFCKARLPYRRRMGEHTRRTPTNSYRENFAALQALHCLTSTSDLLRSHDELRAALRIAGKRIRLLNFGRREDPTLTLLRRVLKEARAVAKVQRCMLP